MMASTSITMRIDSKLKAELQELLANLGLDVTTFFIMTAKQTVRERAIPFKITMDVPNAETTKAMLEVESGKGLSKSFSSVEALLEDLDAED